VLKPRFKISQIFVINFTLLLLGALAIISFVVYYSLKEIEIKQYTTQLKSELAYVRARLDEGKSLAEVGREMSEIVGRPLRVTLIAKDGTPLFDNEADVRTMENHANRPEVMEAWRKGFGTSVRYSRTVKNDRIYAAIPMQWNHRPAILRLSVSLENVMADFQMLWWRLAVVFAFIVAIGIVISLVMQKEIGGELEKLKGYLEAITKKKYDASYIAGFSDEFASIASLLKKLAKRLEKNEKRKRKYTAKLKLINKQRSDVISAISHEFKNPVAAITGYTQTLLDDDGLPVSLRRKFLERIEQNTNRITDMIDRLSFVTRLESSEIAPQKSDFDLLPVLEQTAASLEQKYAGRKVVVEAEPCLIHADRTMMEMVVVNLVDNALKYSDEDVMVTLKDGKLCVSDQGRGIPADDLEKVTKKYYRVDKNAWDNSMGLGLAIVKYILKLHHSEITIDSTLGEGTTICITLPAICQIYKYSKISESSKKMKQTSN
jgi:two-component system phosphate regulon sensor histidine kinase PhoR